MVRHGVENIAHQRFVPPWNPKTILTEIFSQVVDLRYSPLEKNSKINEIHPGISVSNVERDRGQLHQTLGVQGRGAFTINVFSLAGTGEKL